MENKVKIVVSYSTETTTQSYDYIIWSSDYEMGID